MRIREIPRVPYTGLRSAFIDTTDIFLFTLCHMSPAALLCHLPRNMCQSELL